MMSMRTMIPVYIYIYIWLINLLLYSSMTTENPPAFLKVITRSYEDVQVTSEGIDTDEFLKATVCMIDMFGKNKGSIGLKDNSNRVRLVWQ